MKLKISHVFLVSLLFVFNPSVRCQDLIASASYYTANEGGSFTGSIGEAFISEVSDNQHSVSQGFQQPSSGELTNIVFPAKTGITVKISPNPVMDHLTFIVSAEKAKNMAYTLSDINGNVIYEGAISSLQTQLNVSKFPSAIYLLKIKQNNILISSAKIIKH